MVIGQPYSSVAIIGGGAWGTALAYLCVSNGVETTLWAREQNVVNAINETHENSIFLPNVALPKALKATRNLGETVSKAAIIFVVPAQYARSVMAQMAEQAPPSLPVALCSKGIELASENMMTEVLGAVWPTAIPAVLSGPSFARDVALGLPTAVTLACADANIGARWIATVGAPHFRPYLSDDLVGAELGGAVKNVLAIAAGAVAGRDLGESARAALIARGFAEFQRLGVAMGAKAQTMAGLSGLGDLILTASSVQSRNMSLGLELGKGRSLEDILGERQTVSEGVASAAAVVRLAEKVGVEMPICSAVAQLVNNGARIDDIITQLLSRPFKSETK